MTAGTGEAPEVVRAHCNGCGGPRSSFVRAVHTKHSSDEGGVVDWWDTYQVLECCGCGDVIVRHEYRFSEDTEFEQDLDSGELHEVPKVRTLYYPPARVRPLPEWFDRLGAADALLAEVLGEIYAALQDGSLVLATAGARILLDRAMVLLLDVDAGGFAHKLDVMVERGVIGRDDRELLSVMTDAGSAASHRSYKPSREHLETILDTIENLLHRKFVLQKAAAAVKAATPPRKSKSAARASRRQGQCQAPRDRPDETQPDARVQVCVAKMMKPP